MVCFLHFLYWYLCVLGFLFSVLNKFWPWMLFFIRRQNIILCRRLKISSPIGIELFAYFGYIPATFWLSSISFLLKEFIYLILACNPVLYIPYLDHFAILLPVLMAYKFTFYHFEILQPVPMVYKFHLLRILKYFSL